MQEHTSLKIQSSKALVYVYTNTAKTIPSAGWVLRQARYILFSGDCWCQQYPWRYLQWKPCNICIGHQWGDLLLQVFDFKYKAICPLYFGLNGNQQDGFCCWCQALELQQPLLWVPWCGCQEELCPHLAERKRNERGKKQAPYVQITHVKPSESLPFWRLHDTFVEGWIQLMTSICQANFKLRQCFMISWIMFCCENRSLGMVCKEICFPFFPFFHFQLWGRWLAFKSASFCLIAWSWAVVGGSSCYLSCELALCHSIWRQLGLDSQQGNMSTCTCVCGLICTLQVLVLGRGIRGVGYNYRG